jgi:hypothetical protein
MKKILDYLAYKSFLLTKVIFGLTFLLITIYYYFVSEFIPFWLKFMMIFICGIFLGYIIAYFSIIHIQAENKDRMQN